MDRDLQHMLSAAVLAGSANVVQQLLEQGADVNLGDLLHMAASANDVAVATTLIRNGAYLNMPGRLYDDTPLLAACRRGHMEAARVLLDAHADVDAADSGGTTSLHLAAKLRHVGLAIMLIRTYGADKSATNWAGQTPEQEARSPEVRQLIQDLDFQWEVDHIERAPRWAKKTIFVVTLIRTCEPTCILSLLPNELLFLIFEQLCSGGRAHR